KSLELAANKYIARHENDPDFHGNFQTGGLASTALELLTGHKAEALSPEGSASLSLFGSNKEQTKEEVVINFLGTHEDKLDSTAIVFSAGVDPNTGLPIRKDSPVSAGAHEFVITNIDTKAGTVTFVNPWNTSKPITMDIDEFAKLPNLIETVDL
ncbi:MAG: hypothetical protein HC848_03790, partial [Limnobacter sp.]|nr:hypothetical protein [Limnobacter sp.]